MILNLCNESSFSTAQGVWIPFFSRIVELFLKSELLFVLDPSPQFESMLNDYEVPITYDLLSIWVFKTTWKLYFMTFRSELPKYPKGSRRRYWWMDEILQSWKNASSHWKENTRASIFKQQVNKGIGFLMKNLAEFYNLKCEKSVQPMGSTSLIQNISINI